MNLRHRKTVDADQTGQDNGSKKGGENAFDPVGLNTENETGNQDDKGRHRRHLVDVGDDRVETGKPVVVAEKLLKIHGDFLGFM